jgi:hypothetical protein
LIFDDEEEKEESKKEKESKKEAVAQSLSIRSHRPSNGRLPTLRTRTSGINTESSAGTPRGNYLQLATPPQSIEYNNVNVNDR